MTTSQPRPIAHSGTKWVDLNYEAKEHARTLNGGVQPPTPALYTSNFPNKDVWSSDNLPEVLFYLELPENPLRDVKPETFLRDDGTVLRKFDSLPDYISVDAEGWLLHTWRCIDSRIQLQDITDRMTEDRDYFGHVLKKPPANALSNHSYRGCRKILGSYNDYARRDQPHRATVESVEKLSYEKIWTNSVLSRSVQFPDRLVRLKFVRKGKDATGQYEAKPVEVTQENYLETTFPIDHFCVREFDPCVVSELEYKLLPAMSILFDLQRKAELHGLGHWKDLEKECLPESWFDRTREGAPDKPTFDGGCEVCTWEHGQDASAPKPQAFNFQYLRQRNAQHSPAIDLKKAFISGVGTSSEPSFKQEPTLKRNRAYSIESDSKQALTPVVSRTADLRHPDSAPAALRNKRVKLRTLKKSTKATAILEEDLTVPELPLAVPLEKGTRYRIKYLEKDDQYNGFWETDTEVEPDSDAETVVDLITEMPMGSKALRPAMSLPMSPPRTLVRPSPQHRPGPVEDATDSIYGYNPLQETGYFPVDFLDHNFARDGSFPGQHTQSLALIAGTPLDDPFSSFTSSSSFESFVPQDHWLATPFSDFDAQNLDLNPNQLRGQSMNTLLHHSAALHSVLGLNSVQHKELSLPDQTSGDRPLTSGADFQRHIIGPSLIGDSSGHPKSNKHSQLTPSRDLATPYKQHDQNFTNLIFTDELNRFEGFGNHMGVSALEESPSKNFRQNSGPSINMFPTSPIKASIVNANRRIFTINEGEEPEL